MVFIKPQDKETERILRQLSLSGRAYSMDMGFVRRFSSQKPIREAVNLDFLDIAHNHKKKKTIFVTPPNIMVIPKPGEHGINFHFKRFKVL